MIKRLSVIIPVYGNGTTIRELRDRLDDVLRSLPVDDHELIFVDDASPDDSWEVIEAIADQVVVHAGRCVDCGEASTLTRWDGAGPPGVGSIGPGAYQPVCAAHWRAPGGSG